MLPRSFYYSDNLKMIALGPSFISVVLNQMWFLTPRGHLAMSGYIFNCYNWGSAPGIHWVEARSVDEHPIMHRTSPQQNNHQTKNVKSTKVEKAQFIHSRNISHRVQLCATHCATFWESRNEGDSLCLPELPSASKNNEAYLKGQYNTVRTVLELMTEEYVNKKSNA